MRRAVIATLVLALGALVLGAVVAAAPKAAPAPRVLVFTKTAGFRHGSIPVALRAVRELGEGSGVAVDATENAGAFTQSNLSHYRAVVFLLTTGDVLNERQQAAFQRFVRAGGGFAGIHSAADTEHGWAWYGGLVGTHFRNHPHIQRASVRVRDRRHPSTVGLPATWARGDEWYNFARNPRPAVRVLATLDESSYSPGDGAMGANHPIAWSHEYQGGRAWYTGGGHTDESYAEPLFRKHLLGGIRYAAGLTPPRISSVASAVRERRLLVTVRYRSCYPCSGRLDVVVHGRHSRAPIRFGGEAGRARTAPLPRGRWQFSVELIDRATGLRHALRRSVVVR